MATRLPIWKRLGFTALIFAGFLALLEGALSLAPRVMRRAHGTVAVGPESASVVVYCAGDSVTYGMGLDVDESYPWQLAERLTARGLTDTRVLMFANPGAVASTLTVNLLPELALLPLTQRPVVYAMFGHNDLFDWDARSTPEAFAGLRAPEDPRSLENLRILRVLRWFQTAVGDTSPSLDLEERKLDMIQSALRDASAYLRQRAGELILLTYVVPPEPPAWLPERTARVIHLTHVGQPRINAALREIAGGLDVEVIDLEHLIDTGPVWNTTWWLDNIHLSARGLGRVADEVQEHVLTSGLLVSSRQPSSG